MSDNLATIIDKVQAILGDTGGIRFDDTTVTAAIRQALSEWNMRAPQFLAVTITGVNDQYEYELSDEDSGACEIIDVLLRGTDTAQDESTSLGYDAYIENERMFFRLRQPVTSSNTLIVRYAKPHTINGLDSATESTLRSQDDQAMVNGGAFFAIMIRAASRVETVNLSQDQTDNYRELAGGFGAMFSQRMAYAAKQRKPAVSEPDARTWADGEKYNRWDT
jgi:hypothetical protein